MLIILDGVKTTTDESYVETNLSTKVLSSDDHPDEANKGKILAKTGRHQEEILENYTRPPKEPGKSRSNLRVCHEMYETNEFGEPIYTYHAMRGKTNLHHHVDCKWVPPDEQPEIDFDEELELTDIEEFPFRPGEAVFIKSTAKRRTETGGCMKTTTNGDRTPDINQIHQKDADNRKANGSMKTNGTRRDTMDHQNSLIDMPGVVLQVWYFGLTGKNFTTAIMEQTGFAWCYVGVLEDFDGEELPGVLKTVESLRGHHDNIIGVSTIENSQPRTVGSGTIRCSTNEESDSEERDHDNSQCNTGGKFTKQLDRSDERELKPDDGKAKRFVESSDGKLTSIDHVRWRISARVVHCNNIMHRKHRTPILNYAETEVLEHQIIRDVCFRYSNKKDYTVLSDNNEIKAWMEHTNNRFMSIVTLSRTFSIAMRIQNFWEKQHTISHVRDFISFAWYSVVLGTNNIQNAIVNAIQKSGRQRLPASMVGWIEGIIYYMLYKRMQRVYIHFLNLVSIASEQVVISIPLLSSVFLSCFGFILTVFGFAIIVVKDIVFEVLRYFIVDWFGADPETIKSILPQPILVDLPPKMDEESEEHYIERLGKLKTLFQNLKRLVFG